MRRCRKCNCLHRLDVVFSGHPRDRRQRDWMQKAGESREDAREGQWFPLRVVGDGYPFSMVGRQC